MGNYRMRPVEPAEVDARQVTDATADEIAAWCDAMVYRGIQHGHTTPPFTQHTCITLDAAAYEGDWVVRYPDGEFYVFSPEEFAAAFEPVTGQDL